MSSVAPCADRIAVAECAVCISCGGLAVGAATCSRCEPVFGGAVGDPADPIISAEAGDVAQNLRAAFAAIAALAPPATTTAPTSRIAGSRAAWKARRATTSADTARIAVQRAQVREQVEQARWRPAAVVARTAGDPRPTPAEAAVLSVPAEASENAHHVAKAVAAIASVRLATGDSLDFALRKIAAGRDLVKRTLHQLGVTMERRASRARSRSWLSSRSSTASASLTTGKTGSPSAAP